VSSRISNNHLIDFEGKDIELLGTQSRIAKATKNSNEVELKIFLLINVMLFNFPADLSLSLAIRILGSSATKSGEKIKFERFEN
jgi:hypothetical protein